MKINIIGCGLSGVTAAILLKEQGHDVEIFESREHIGGNCYDEKIDDVVVHKYGLHCFHTNDNEVWDFLNRYTKFNNHQLRARANTKLGLISIPYNKKTEEQIRRDLSEEEIHELIFKDYSERHWGIPWDNLPKSISGRVPTKRDSYDDRYSLDKYQGIPVNGYTEMFRNMLDGIKVNLGVGKDDYRKLKGDKMIYTGKPDDFFDYEFGRLEYRSLRFEHKKVSRSDLFSRKSGAQINECNNNTYNRTVDNSVFLDQQLPHTILTRDYPEEHNDTNDPIYPKSFGGNIEMYNKYKEAIKADTNTIFLGRLATYKYLDMWMAIKQVMTKLK